MYPRMGFNVSSVKQPETNSKDILKMWFDIKSSIGKVFYALQLNQKNARMYT